jgi:hypothetical protein
MELGELGGIAGAKKISLGPTVTPTAEVVPTAEVATVIPACTQRPTENRNASIWAFTNLQLSLVSAGMAMIA